MVRSNESTVQRSGSTDDNWNSKINVAFPPCTTELLSLINTSGEKDDITKFFIEYFKFEKYEFEFKTDDISILDKNLKISEWPTECCICNPLINLTGNRNITTKDTKPLLQRLFIGDLLWLFYFERMGIFQILGAILDSFACSGKLPISIKGDTKNSILTIILEIMVRQTKIGMSSTVRDRNCAYRTSLGWMTEAGRKLNLETEVNTGFNSLFHKFINNALEFYRDKRLAIAIKDTLTTKASAATLVSIGETLELLKKRFDPFFYGRNYYNTLAGIIWTISGMSIVRELRTTLGIPPAYDKPDEYIPAAYEILVMKRSITHGESNRYLLHKSCAENGRDILLDLETPISADLEKWLNSIENKVESYRTAYRTLTGIDLGASGTPAVEQQV